MYDFDSFEYRRDSPLTPEAWGKHIQNYSNSDLRARLAQTSCQKGEVGKALCRILEKLSKLSFEDNRNYQVHLDAITISMEVLTKEECLVVAALLYDYVPIAFEPYSLTKDFQRILSAAKKEEASKII